MSPPPGWRSLRERDAAERERDVEALPEHHFHVKAPQTGDQAQTSFALRVGKVLAEIGDMLLEKNRAYGDSALSGHGLFAPMIGPELGIRVRIDDKLSRIKAARNSYDREDAVQDLLGYLVLLMIARDRR